MFNKFFVIYFEIKAMKFPRVLESYEAHEISGNAITPTVKIICGMVLTEFCRDLWLEWAKFNKFPVYFSSRYATRTHANFVRLFDLIW